MNGVEIEETLTKLSRGVLTPEEQRKCFILILETLNEMESRVDSIDARTYSMKDDY